MGALDPGRRAIGGNESRRGRALVWVALGLLVVAVAAGLLVVRPWSHPRPPRILLVGIDGADWRTIRPMLAEGDLPHLTHLIQEGAHGPLWGVPPLTPPVGWTTIATGKAPDQHGVLGFTIPDPRTGQPIVIASGLRRSKAFWNILADHELSVGLIGWWATSPAEAVPGVIVSDRLLGHPFVAPGQLAEGVVYPAERSQQLLHRRDRVKPPSRAEAQRSMDVSAEEYAAASDQDPTDPIGQFRRIYQGMRTAAELARFVQRRDQPDVLAVCFDGIDAACHLYARYAAPAPDSTASELQRKLGRTLREIYRLQDELLGQLLALTDETTTVMVISAYGYRTESEHPTSELRPIDHRVASRAHRPDGILVMKGPSVRRRTGEQSPAAISNRASVFDITPTMLALLGLPVAQDMGGRVLTEMLVEDFPEASRISTFEDAAWARDRAAQRPDYSGLTEGERARLRSLGYVGIDEPGGVFAVRDHEALAEYFGISGDGERAERELLAMIAGAPQEPEPYLRLGIGYLRQNKTDAARAMLEQALALDPKQVEARMSLALIFRELNDRARATSLLEEGLRLHPGHAGLRVNLGMLYKDANDLDRAAQLFEEALRLSPDHHTANAQLAMLLERRGDFEGALPHWQAAARARPDDRLARDHIALIERQLGRAPSQRATPGSGQAAAPGARGEG